MFGVISVCADGFARRQSRRFERPFAAHAATVEEYADGVLDELRDFVEEELEDDVALVALRVTKSVEPLPDEIES